MLFKLLLIFGCLFWMVDARCNLTAQPVELIDCLSHLSSIVIGLVKDDIRRVCDKASLITKCVQDQLAECIGEQIGQAAFQEIIDISDKCCPERNAPTCPIRDARLQEQRCFAADSLVTLADGTHKAIAHLQPGDSLLAYDDHTRNIITTSFLTMLDFQPHHFALFKQLTTITGRHLSLTSSHLLPTDTRGYVMAKNIHPGMNIFVMNEEGVLVTETVTNVSDVMKQGYMAPLTAEGTLIVNNVAASCYATIGSHYVAHAAVAPMRWWYGLFGLAKESNDMIGVHWFARMLFELTSFLIPSFIHQ